MSLSIADIAKGISWMDDGSILMSPQNDAFDILVEYLNNAKKAYLEKDIEQLEQFNEAAKTNNRDKIESFLIGHYGFNQYNDGIIYAYIAGVTDLGISVLYNLDSNKIILKHIYGEPHEKFTINLEDLIHLLKRKKAMENAVAS